MDNSTRIRGGLMIGDEIKRIRIEKGMTQQELADACGLSRSYIARIEVNGRTPNLDVIQSILKSMGYEMEIEIFELPSI